MTRFIDLGDGRTLNPDHIIDTEIQGGNAVVTTVGLEDCGAGFAVSRQLTVAREDVARLLAGGEGETREPMPREIDMNALRLHNESLTAEVERLKRERDEARAKWEASEARHTDIAFEAARFLDALAGEFGVERDRPDRTVEQDILDHIRQLLARQDTAAPAPEPEETDEPDDMGECPSCGQPAPTSEFGVVEHLDGCGWCGHPSSDGDGEDAYICTICGFIITDDEPAPATTPEPTLIDARSPIRIEVHGECVVQPELGPRAERTVWVRDGEKIKVSAPDGPDLYWCPGDDLVSWDDPGSYAGTDLVTYADRAGGDQELWLWLSDPAIDVSQHKDLKYPPGACVLHVRVVPDGEEMPTMPRRAHFHPTPDPAFFDTDAILAAVRDDPEAARQVALMGRYGTHWHWRRHQEAWEGTAYAGLLFDPTETDLRKRFTDGNHGWDALGDAVLVVVNGTAQANDHVDEILRSKLIDNPLCMTPFGLVGKSWDKPSPFRHWFGRAMYRSFVDVVDLALAYKLLQDADLVSAVLSPQDEAHVRENFRRFAAHVEADMAVSDPRMWRTANVLAVECVRHLFPSLGLPDLSHHLTRPDAVLRPTDPPTWGDRGDYTGANMMGVCYSVFEWVVSPTDNDSLHIIQSIEIWSGHDDEWMTAAVKGTDPGNGDLFSCHRFQNSLTELWFPTGRDAVSLGSQDHALYVVAGSSVAS